MCNVANKTKPSECWYYRWKEFMNYATEAASSDMTFHEDRFRHSSNIITSKIRRTAILVLLRKRLVKYTVEIVLDGKIHISSFVKIGSGVQ
jgi:hypothetical protein